MKVQQKTTKRTMSSGRKLAAVSRPTTAPSSEPLGADCIESRIRLATQPLVLTKWALEGRVDCDERKVFCGPLERVIHDLHVLAEDVVTRDVAPRREGEGSASSGRKLAVVGTSTNVPSTGPIGADRIVSSIRLAANTIELFEWALSARFGDVDEFETLSAPLLQAKRRLEALADDIDVYDVAPRRDTSERFEAERKAVAS